MRAMSLAAIATLWIATVPISANAADQIITESFSVTIPGSAVPNASQPCAIREHALSPVCYFNRVSGICRLHPHRRRKGCEP